MRIIERDCKGTQFAVWIDKEEKNLLEALENMRKIYGDADLMLINPKNYQGYNTKAGYKIVLKEWEVLEDD